VLSNEQLQAIKAYADDFNAAMDQVAADIRHYSQPDIAAAAARDFHWLAWITRAAPWPNRRSKRPRRRVPVTGQTVRVIDRKGRAHWRHSPRK
jgi:hypothetical protein